MLDLVEVKQEVSGERRSTMRIRIDRPCKLHDPRSGKYIPARTRDLSEGGVMVEIDQPLAIQAGDELYIGIAQKRRQMLLRSEEMLRLRIVRALGTPSGGTAIAGSFIDRPIVAEPLRRAA